MVDALVTDDDTAGMTELEVLVGRAVVLDDRVKKTAGIMEMVVDQFTLEQLLEGEGEAVVVVELT